MDAKNLTLDMKKIFRYQELINTGNESLTRSQDLFYEYKGLELKQPTKRSYDRTVNDYTDGYFFDPREVESSQREKRLTPRYLKHIN